MIWLAAFSLFSTHIIIIICLITRAVNLIVLGECLAILIPVVAIGNAAKTV
ncbi:hypothetical protein LguiB_016640 [Lonicera macranthoides]